VRIRLLFPRSICFAGGGKLSHIVGCCMTKSQSKLTLTLVALSLTALGVLFVGVLKAPVAPPQPEYQGMALQQWIRAEPQMRVTSHEDIMRYRSEALAKMGEPAAGYLMWMIRNPRLTLDGHSSRLDRLSQRLPGRLRKFAPSPPKARANFMNVVIALQLLGPKAREAVPDLLKLWDSKGNPEYAYYNGFPLTLVALGDASPKVLTALHQRFSSPDRLHRALCALAAWRLDPSDTGAAARVRAELLSTDSQDYTRYALLESLSHLGSRSAPFVAEVEALISKSGTADTWKRQTAAIAAWRLLNLDQPARDLLKQLAGRVASPNCPKSDSDEFSAAALSLIEVPGTREIAVPCLKQLSEHTDASAASFASSILARVEAAVPVGPDEPEQQRRGQEDR